MFDKGLFTHDVSQNMGVANPPIFKQTKKSAALRAAFF